MTCWPTNLSIKSKILSECGESIHEYPNQGTHGGNVWILRYLKITPCKGLFFKRSDWAGDVNAQ